MKFNEKVFKLRKMKGLTQDDFAAAVGVSRQAVYKWESGQSYPEVPKLLEMKLLFGISIDDLLDDNFDVVVPEKQKKKRISREKKEEIERKVEENITVLEEKPLATVAATPEVKEDITEETSVSAVTYEAKEEQKEEVKEESEKKRGFFSRLFGRK